jgi:hypothetical protein
MTLAKNNARGKRIRVSPTDAESRLKISLFELTFIEPSCSVLLSPLELEQKPTKNLGDDINTNFYSHIVAGG